VLFPPQTESFPRISAYLDVHDTQGEFIHNIQASQVRVLENGRSLPVVELEELRPGIQIVFAVSPGAPFSIRDSQGVSRYEFLRDGLAAWAQSRGGSTLDDLSLLLAAGPEFTHFNDSLEIVSALGDYQPNLEVAAPGLDILLRAIDLAADSPPRPGMERAVVLVTAPPQGDITFGLQELSSRAAQLRVHVTIWLVASKQALSSPAARSLAGLAEQTGGQFFAFSGDEPLPDLESYFSSLRDIYRLAYDSQITGGGTQQLAVEIQRGDQVITSDPQPFDFDLQPPDPAFISPATLITRALPAAKRNNLWQQAGPDELVPATQELQVLIDFPDGRARPLVRTALYVDGLLVDANTEPPFDYFTWDLSAYRISGQHLLQVEAVDSLGQRGASIMFPVQISVELSEPNPIRELLRHWPALAGLTALLIVAVAILVLILSGRIRPRFMAPSLGLRLPRRPRLPRFPKPAVHLEHGSGDVMRRLPAWVNRWQWPQRRLHPNASAYLAYLTEAGEKPAIPPISIAMDELTFGLDPSLATIVLDDPSVGGLHARLTRQADGSLRLVDEGSVAGTWVNYTPVAGEGQVLEHGDLVHFGRVGFRFTQRDPQHVRRPVITFEEPPA